jgi:hypothetical protein
MNFDQTVLPYRMLQNKQCRSKCRKFIVCDDDTVFGRRFIASLGSTKGIFPTQSLCNGTRVSDVISFLDLVIQHIQHRSGIPSIFDIPKAQAQRS